MKATIITWIEVAPFANTFFVKETKLYLFRTEKNS